MNTDQPIDKPAIFDIDTFPLTDDQRSAVVHEAGPVIVLAGPGTGKTRVITARVAHMITNRGIDPSQIVAVTFTNKAAGELGERLGELVETNIAVQVVSSTFHSLGLKILRRFGDVLGLPSDPMLIDSSQRNTLIRQIIQEQSLYQYAMGRGIENAVGQASKTMDELRNLGMFSSDAIKWLATARASAANLDGVEAVARGTELDRFEQAVMVYQHFESGCRDRGWMVFDDLIMLPSKLMREHPSIAAILRQDHRHVVVDEFQDVNAGQIELIRQLCPPSTNPDLCVVGDDDQSIYGFRGADDRAFAIFADSYPGTPTITLSTNFRSAKAVVDASNAIIDRAQVRFDSNKIADAFAGDVEGSGVELVRLEGDRQAEEVVASMLLKLASDGGKDGEPFDFGSCAVIARTGNELETIGRVLALEGIPVDIKERVSPMDDEGVQDVLAWARLLIDPSSTVEMKRVLVRPPYRSDPKQIARLIIKWQVAASYFAKGVEDSKDPGELLSWIIEHGDEPIKERAGLVSTMLSELGVIASEKAAAETVVEIVKRSGVVHGELGDGRARATRVRSVVALISFARSRAERFEAPGDLGAMLRYWDDLDPGEKSLGELPEHKVEHDQGPLGQSPTQGVAMLTAHASKGLEYDTVFIPRVNGPHGYPKTAATDDDFLPVDMIDRGDDQRDAKARKIDEERRVFYVALTRAKSNAVVLSKVPKKPSGVSFVFELRESLGNEFVERDAHELLDPNTRSDAVSRLGAEFRSVSAMRDVFDQAKSDARRSAAAAIDAFEIGDLDRDQLSQRLIESADQIAIVRAVLKDGEAPKWASEGQQQKLAELLIDTLAQEEIETSGAIHAGLQGPLTLSFSQISKYLHCPRCYLVNYVLKLPQVSAVSTMMGTMIHEALDQFYKQWMLADADGQPKPGFEVLNGLIDKEFYARSPRDQELDEASLEQVQALGRNYWESFHTDDAHIEELEREFVFAYESENEAVEPVHKLKAKLDRIDVTASGGRRVIDYKTGHARKDLIKPSKTDLQLGVYAMALESFCGDPGPGSMCEYWLLQDGSRGVIEMDSLNMKSIRKKIDRAIAGMLAGDWDQSKACQNGAYGSPCEILDEAKEHSLLIADKNTSEI